MAIILKLLMKKLSLLLDLGFLFNLKLIFNIKLILNIIYYPLFNNRTQPPKDLRVWKLIENACIFLKIIFLCNSARKCYNTQN